MTVDSETKDYLRTWPLLLVAAVAFTIGAIAFFKQKDYVASAASMTTGVLVLGLWAGVEIYRAGRFDHDTEPPLQHPDSDHEEADDAAGT